MAWNQPGNNGQDRDPWGNGNSGGNRNGGRNQPPNMDDLFSKVNRMLGKLVRGGGNFRNNNSERNINGPSSSKLILLGLVAAVVVWGLAGLYTIQEGEVGVVTRFGKLQKDFYVQPGLNWRPIFVDKVKLINNKRHRTLEMAGTMLTKDENVVQVSMSVEYSVDDPANFVYSVTNPEDSLKQATDSALRAVIGKYDMDYVLTDGRQVVRDDTQRELINIIKLYTMGTQVIQVNLQDARPPNEVKAAFDDVIDAREDEQRYIFASRAYSNKVLPKAQGDASRILANARAYRESLVFEAKGEAERFNRLLPEYNQAQEVTRQRLYLETMEKVLSKNSKIIMDTSSNNLMVMPLDQLLGGKVNTAIEMPSSTQGTDAMTSASEVIVTSASRNVANNSVSGREPRTDSLDSTRRGR